ESEKYLDVLQAADIDPTARLKPANREMLHGVTLGGSPKMIAALNQASELAPGDLPVLIRGPRGCGKENFARLIHALWCQANGRKEKDTPFVPVNVAAVPEHLLESELFGHVKNAFTGANESRLGRIAKAKGGTLFLDEIGDMPMTLQSKILRFMQDGTYYPVGSDDEKKSDARVIAATNQHIEDLVSKNLFRRDLKDRLLLRLVIPSLNETLDRIPALLEEEVPRISGKMKKKVPKNISAAVISELKAHNWEGNIRELQGVIAKNVASLNGAAWEHVSWPQSEEPVVSLPVAEVSSITDARVVDGVAATVEQCRLAERAWELLTQRQDLSIGYREWMKGHEIRFPEGVKWVFDEPDFARLDRKQKLEIRQLTIIRALKGKEAREPADPRAGKLLKVDENGARNPLHEWSFNVLVQEIDRSDLIDPKNTTYRTGTRKGKKGIVCRKDLGVLAEALFRT
ncbi:MAG: sigma 54-interacting transcriptional regulator, partial [Kiritimatiellia bacterium]